MLPQEYKDNIIEMIDDLKALSTDLGLSNTGDEYKIISELFTYKFLNDKLLYEFEARQDKDETLEEFAYYAGSKTVTMKEGHFIHNLYHKQSEKNFHVIFDKILEEISELNKDVYSVETAMGNKKPLFEPLKAYLRDEDKELELAKRAINILHTYKFENIFDGGFDFFSSIFEYLIKDYNKDSGKYAEYFTPLSAGKIIAEILYNNTPVSNVRVYDPAAGSGTLLLSMADKIGTNNCSIYSQDISQKSTQFLRINLILNRLAHSLHNVKEGNTLIMPSHKDRDNLMKFDFIVSNPPFKTDFSSMVETLKADSYNRFFAGVPNVPIKDKESMAIYLCFLQHIIASLSETGKAAVVVPSGFLTATKRSAKIAYNIRKLIIDEKMLKGVISMPSNIFATTGTNVSIIFIDKSHKDSDIILIDASKLGDKIKDSNNNQRTVLSHKEERLIVDTFNSCEVVEDFSIKVTNDDIKQKDYSFSAGQYFQVKFTHVDIASDEFEKKIVDIKGSLKTYFEKSRLLEDEILKDLEGIMYE